MGVQRHSWETPKNMSVQETSESSRASRLSRLKILSIDEYLAENPLLNIDLSGIASPRTQGEAIQATEKSGEPSSPAVIIEFGTSAEDRESEARDHERMLEIQSLYDEVYLIDRMDERLIAVKSYAQLRCLMLAGRPGEALLCLADPADRDAVAEFVKRPTYNSAHAYTWRSTDAGLVSFCGLYPDGWNHGNQLGVVSGIACDVSVRARVSWLPEPGADVENRLLVSVGDRRSEIVLRDDTSQDLEIELSGNGIAYLWSSTTREASDIWSNTDPRVLGFCLSEIQVEIKLDH